MAIEVIEMAVKCRVPQDEAEDCVIRLRRGKERLPVPPGLRCRDAFDTHETQEPGTAVLRVGYW
jgi:hypothetical protein